MRAWLFLARSLTSFVRIVALPPLLVLGANALSQSAVAQDRNFTAYFLDVKPAEFVAAAWAQPYGRAVVAQFAAALNASADPACLKTTSLTPERLADRARAMLLERGTLLLERQIAMIERATFQNYLRARIGGDGVAELNRLRDDPAVRAYRAADEPAELAFVVLSVIENISRYARITRVKLVKPISPLESDIPSIEQADPTGAIDAKLKQMVANDKSGALARYLEIAAMTKKPFNDATNMAVAIKFGPGELLARPGKDNRDLYNEFVELCVAPKTEQ